MAAGVLCGRTGTSDVIDASVALCARERSHAVVTSDPKDIATLDPRLRLIVVQRRSGTAVTALSLHRRAELVHTCS